MSRCFDKGEVRSNMAPLLSPASRVGRKECIRVDRGTLATLDPNCWERQSEITRRYQQHGGNNMPHPGMLGFVVNSHISRPLIQDLYSYYRKPVISRIAYSTRGSTPPCASTTKFDDLRVHAQHH
jgi:hypothetical protein